MELDAIIEMIAHERHKMDEESRENMRDLLGSAIREIVRDEIEKDREKRWLENN